MFWDMHSRVCVYACVCTYACAYVHMYISMFMGAYVHGCLCACMYLCVHGGMYAFVCGCMVHVCQCACLSCMQVRCLGHTCTVCLYAWCMWMHACVSTHMILCTCFYMCMYTCVFLQYTILHGHIFMCVLVFLHVTCVFLHVYLCFCEFMCISACAWLRVCWEALNLPPGSTSLFPISLVLL